MPKVKICGLSRLCDIEAVNEAGADFAGFVIDYNKSHRSISTPWLSRLTGLLNRDRTKAVGVFVNQDVKKVASLLKSGVIDIAQLHGDESDEYVSELKMLYSATVIKAFVIDKQTPQVTLDRALKSSADFVLIDSGMGSGASFDFSMLKGFGRNYFLAGGLGAYNIKEAVFSVNPYAIDLSSGVEVDKKKDRDKILEVVNIVRNCEVLK